MRRREFIAGIGAVWPIAALAQSFVRQRRVGLLMGWADSGPLRTLVGALVEGLTALGWMDNNKLELDVRWSGGNVERTGALARELVERQPDVLIAASTPVAIALQRETRTIPIVFAVVSDPVGAGFIKSLPQPGGNMTGFINIEAAMGGKWLEFLKEAAPNLDRVALMFNPDTAPGGGTFFQPAFEAAARVLRIETSLAPVRSDLEIGAAIELLGRQRGGLLVSSDSFMNVHRRTIIAAATLHRVPFISDVADVPREGGLIAYGPNYPDIFRRCATYVDRILKGANPADLPVEVPIKFELVINTKTAASMGLVIPASMLARADEIVE